MIYAIAYIFIALSTALAVIEKPYSRNEIIATAFVGAIWPLWLVVRIILKIK
jgi:hypothetical protein